ncbi:hypothetical protein [Lysobacter humi (ex Lee et al. 2017)]
MDRSELMQRSRPGLAASIRCDALRRLGALEWPVRERRGVLMLLLHAGVDASPAVRFTALDALVDLAARYPRLRVHAAALLARWAASACRATAIHASRLLADATFRAHREPATR